jgi:serine/threonine-protein kinase
LLELGLQNVNPDTFTIAPPRAKPPSSASATEEGRFIAGTILAARYRVLGLVGRGGMGEVYRATDLKLNQPVALKFLPESTGHNPRLIERFHGEVRIARQVSHPNVCRVYDIGEVDGAAYISMEYVDGEDLGSLLRRIGRLPGDKAIEIARKLCAGLAAAHAKGVLHRDLKPANIMIDGQGQVLIMDFGLAAIADQVEGAEIRNGTPAYMAPEQLAGREVTERSDIYALGLVLYEIFTGRPAFKTRDRDALPSVASVVKDIDPAIERVIARCLDPDPAKRPQSALALARMLPGGDPLAEALAAGNTPSPEMVAASEDTGALSVRAAVACMAFVVAGLIGLLLLSSRISVLRLTPFPNSGEILARQGREIAARLGYTSPPIDAYDTFNYEDEYHNWAERNLPKENYREQVRHGQPSLIYFTHRESPGFLDTRDPYGRPTPNDPPVNVSGMVSLDLDPQGRLIRFLGVPSQLDDGGAPAQSTDWKKLFEAAGLDAPRWSETASEEIPPFAFDERKAWTGTFAHAPKMRMRIEAASWKGRPVSFELFGPWRRPARLQQPAPQTTGQRAAGWSLVGVLSIVLVISLWLAMRNLRAGRGDTSGALRLGAFGLIFWSVSEIVRLHHVPTLGELIRVVYQIGIGLFVAACVWVLYMALEPYLRRRWPQSLISWSRLLGGGARDPLVAGHILAGTALGVGFTLILGLRSLIDWRSMAVMTMNPFTIQAVDGAGLVGWLLWNMIGPAIYTLVGFCLFVPLRLLFRRTWVAAAIYLAVYVAFGVGSDPLPHIVLGMALIVSGIWVGIRFGLLPITLVFWLQLVGSQAPVTSDLSAWYASKGLMVVALILALAVWSFRNALGGRKVLQDDFL